MSNSTPKLFTLRPEHIGRIFTVRMLAEKCNVKVQTIMARLDKGSTDDMEVVYVDPDDKILRKIPHSTEPARAKGRGQLVRMALVKKGFTFEKLKVGRPAIIQPLDDKWGDLDKLARTVGLHVVRLSSSYQFKNKHGVIVLKSRSYAKMKMYLLEKTGEYAKSEMK